MQTAHDRALTAQTLKEEAGLLLHRSGLFRLLEERFDKVRITGSAAYDLMVGRDIDIHMPVEASAWPEWAYLISEVARQLQDAGLELYKARYANDYVVPHPMGGGLGWGVEFQDFAGQMWRFDLRGWDPFDYAIREARDESLRLDLTRADRDLILRLKTEALQRRLAGQPSVASIDIYRFCIEGAGERFEDLLDWLPLERS